MATYKKRGWTTPVTSMRIRTSNGELLKWVVDAVLTGKPSDDCPPGQLIVEHPAIGKLQDTGGTLLPTILHIENNPSLTTIFRLERAGDFIVAFRGLRRVGGFKYPIGVLLPLELRELFRLTGHSLGITSSDYNAMWNPSSKGRLS